MAPETLVVGTVLGNYQIDRLIGSGEMGQVYAATHVLLKKPVALKVLSRELVREPVLVQRFLREGRAAARVRHDHIIDVSDVGIADDLPYLAMELLDGEPLARRFARGPMDADELASIMLPVVAAVATAHDAGVIHRDLKPDNIFLRRDARRRLHPVVLDFGLSRIAEEAQLALTDTNALMGTPYYMSPEQVHSAKDITPATDQYALGVVMYEGLVGHRPFAGDSLLDMFKKVTSGLYERPHTANPEIPEALGKIMERAMSRLAEARYPNLWLLGWDLLPFASARDQETWRPIFSRPKPGPFRMEVDVPQEPRERRPGRLAFAIAGGLIAAGLLAGLFVGLRASRR